MVFTFSLLLFSSLLVFDIYQKCNILCVRATSLKCLQHFYAKQKRERKKYCTCISRQSQRCWPSWMGYIQRACWPRYLTRMWKARHGEKISLQERRLFDDLREKKNYTHSKELVSRVENENISQLNCQRTNRFFFFFFCVASLSSTFRLSLLDFLISWAHHSRHFDMMGKAFLQIETGARGRGENEWKWKWEGNDQKTKTKKK